MDIMFVIVPIFIAVIFCIVIGSFIFAAVKGVTQWKKNNNSPVLTLPVKLISKRTSVSHSTHSAGDNMPAHTSTSTWYYVTFETEGGYRREFQINGQEFGLLVEGDCGNLTFQGTRYQGFARTPGMTFVHRPGMAADPFADQAPPAQPAAARPQASASGVRPQSAGASNARPQSTASGNRPADPGCSAPVHSGSEPAIEFFFSDDEAPASADANASRRADFPASSGNTDRSDNISFPDADSENERNRLAVTWEETHRSQNR